MKTTKIWTWALGAGASSRLLRAVTTSRADGRAFMTGSAVVRRVEYLYDELGERVGSVQDGATYPLRMEYDLQRRRTALTTFRDAGGAASSPPAGDTTRWTLDLSETLQGAGGVGGLLAVSVNGSFYFPCYDNNGNVTKYIDESGSVVASYAYDAFGRIIAQTGFLADVFPHRFSTKYFDSETGLYYYGYRFYHPALMRWLTRDPIAEKGGVNLYVFEIVAGSDLTLLAPEGYGVFLCL